MTREIEPDLSLRFGRIAGSSTARVSPVSAVNREDRMLQNDAGKVAVTLSQGQSVSLVHPDGTVCVVAPTPKQVGKCHLVIMAPKTVRIERDKGTVDEIVRLRAERDEARRKYNKAEASNLSLLSRLHDLEAKNRQATK